MAVTNSATVLDMVRPEVLGKVGATFKVVEVVSGAEDTTTGADMGANSAVTVEDGDGSEIRMSVPHCYALRNILL